MHKHITVFGLGRSGLAVARFFKNRGAHVTVTDQAAENGLGVFAEQARQLDVKLELGGHCSATFAESDMVVISPGVPHTIDALDQARQQGVEVIGEVELASRFIKAPIIAVSGTNGKTTTTELLGRMLAASGLQVFVGGNIGNPLIEIAGRDADLDVIVAEISSFQLDTIKRFQPYVAVLLNISSDHLDRYPDKTAYAAAKGRLFINQTPQDYAVCNGDDALVQQQCKNINSAKLDFFLRPEALEYLQEGAVISDDKIQIQITGKIQGSIDLSRSLLIGRHNFENTAAASLAALVAGATLEGVQTAVDTFKGLAHRMEFVDTINGVQFVNDSKATNVDAVIRALACFEMPVVLIMGGRNKGYDFALLEPHVRKHVKKMIVIGEAAGEILDVLGHAPRQGVQKVTDMTEAVHQAFASARPGETVLLSPACASFDMFGSYAERGEQFRQLVGELR